MYLHRRLIPTTALWFALALLAPSPADAATPASGTVSPASPTLTYASGPFTAANPTPVPEVDHGPECLNPAQPCDDFTLTVVLPAGYHATYPNAFVKVSEGWVDTGAGA